MVQLTPQCYLPFKSVLCLKRHPCPLKSFGYSIMQAKFWVPHLSWSVQLWSVMAISFECEQAILNSVSSLLTRYSKQTLRAGNAAPGTHRLQSMLLPFLALRWHHHEYRSMQVLPSVITQYGQLSLPSNNSFKISSGPRTFCLPPIHFQTPRDIQLH